MIHSYLRKTSHLIPVLIFISMAQFPGYCQQKEIIGAEIGQIEKEIKDVSKQIEELRTSPDAPEKWKELQKTIKKLDEIQKENFKREQEYRDLYYKLWNLDEVKEWQKLIAPLSDRQQKLYVQQWKLIRSKGKELCEARHRELARFAAQKYPGLKTLAFDLLSYPKMDGSTSTLPLASLIS